MTTEASASARASRERMQRFGIRPNRELGQNFLVDPNILDLIGRVSDLGRDDVVLEIGGGLGILSEYLAARAGRLHVIEADASLEPLLAEALGPHEGAGLVIADVMDLELNRLRPPPTKVVANLPYGVAVPALLKTIEELPGAAVWCVMVQREIAERVRAGPSSRAYGVPSVLVQLACDVELVRPVSRTVFHPAPNVDSALVRLRRIGSAASPPVHSLVHAAFAHRRKALARSLELALGGEAPGGGSLRDAARAALSELELPVDARAETLSPAQFVELAAQLEGRLPRR